MVLLLRRHFHDVLNELLRVVREFIDLLFNEPLLLTVGVAGGYVCKYLNMFALRCQLLHAQSPVIVDLECVTHAFIEVH